MTIAINSGFANNRNDAQGRKDAALKTTALPFRDYLAPTAATTPDKTSFVSGTISGKATEVHHGRRGQPSKRRTTQASAPLVVYS
jgi:hypothetical protein